MIELIDTIRSLSYYSIIESLGITFVVFLVLKSAESTIKKKLILISSKTSNVFDDHIFNSNLIGRVLLFIPFFVFAFLSSINDFKEYSNFIDIIIEISTPILFSLLGISILDVVNKIYINTEIYNKIPFFAGIQLFKIIIFISYRDIYSLI